MAIAALRAEPRERRRRREQLHVRGQRPLASPPPARRPTSPLSASTTNSPLAAPPPRASRPRIWSQARSWHALPRQQKQGRAGGRQQDRARLMASTNTRASQGSGSGGGRGVRRRADPVAPPAGLLRPADRIPACPTSWDNPCLWAKSSTSSPSPAVNAQVAKSPRRRPWSSAAAASPAASTRSAPCARSTCSRSTAPSTTSTSMSAPAPAPSSPAMLANGVTPDEMMQVINDRVPSELEDLDLDRVLRPNYLGFLQKAALLPLRTAELLRALVADRRLLGDRHRRRPGRGAADRPLLGRRDRRLRRGGARRQPAASTTSACSTASST